jgi:hypothetical protein
MRSACIALLSCEKYLPNQIGIVVLASFGDQLAIEAKVKMVALLITPAVVCDGVATGESSHMRTFTDDRFNSHIQPLRKEPAKRGDLLFDEFTPPFEGRKFRHRTDDREGEVIGYRLLKNPRISVVEIFQKLTRPLTLFLDIQNGVLLVASFLTRNDRAGRLNPSASLRVNSVKGVGMRVPSLALRTAQKERRLARGSLSGTGFQPVGLTGWKPVPQENDNPFKSRMTCPLDLYSAAAGRFPESIPIAEVSAGPAIGAKRQRLSPCGAL